MIGATEAHTWVAALNRDNMSMVAPNLIATIWRALETKTGIFIGIVLTAYLLQVSYYILLHPLSTVPGPFLAKFSNLWINIRYIRGSWHEDILAVHQQYGDVVRITPNEVSFVDVQALKTVYGYSTGTKKVSHTLQTPFGNRDED